MWLEALIYICHKKGSHDVWSPYGCVMVMSDTPKATLLTQRLADNSGLDSCSPTPLAVLAEVVLSMVKEAM